MPVSTTLYTLTACAIDLRVSGLITRRTHMRKLILKLRQSLFQVGVLALLPLEIRTLYAILVVMML